LTIAGASSNSEDDLTLIITPQHEQGNFRPDDQVASTTLPPVNLLWSSFATNQANIPTPQTHVPTTQLTPAPTINVATTTETCECTESPTSIFHYTNHIELPIKTPMSHILDDFLHVHNEKDVLQERLKQAELHFSTEMERMHITQAAQDKSLLSTLDLLNKERQSFQHENGKKIESENINQTTFSSFLPSPPFLSSPIKKLLDNYESLNNDAKKALLSVALTSNNSEFQ